MTEKWFVCLKHGTKYSAEYVNVLHSMFQRNCSSEVKFACYTENTDGLNKDIQTFPLPTLPVQGWWYKPLFFNPMLPTQGTVLFCDLDVIIFNKIDKLFDYEQSKFCIIRDFTRHQVPSWNKMNSSVFRFDTGFAADLYKEFVINLPSSAKRYHGDQDWMYHNIKKDYVFWPDEWIQSYKWEMRKKAPMIRTSNGRNFSEPGVPIIQSDTSIAVFHGEPNPHNCVDLWCKENWR